MATLNRLLKNAHLRRSPHPSSCQARGRLVAVDVVGNGLKPFPIKDLGRPQQTGFRRLNLHLGIFDQPNKSKFFNGLSTPVIQNTPLFFFLQII